MVAAFEDQGTVTLSTQRLAAMLADVSEAMGDNNMRPYLNGAIFSLDMEGLWIAATDEYRLMVAHEPINLGDKKLCRSCILPRKAILLAKKLLVQGGDVQLSLGSKNIQFTFDGGNVLFSKTVEGNYPDWRLAIPSRQNTVTVNALDLSDALAMLITAVDDALSMKGLKNALQVSIGNTAMTLRRGESGVCNIDCRNETQSACEFMVNICFLSDSMRTLKTHSEQSIIGFSSSECAITVRPKGSDYPLSVIMPIKK
jgi:DNA polymerase-3 subunit beta